MITEQQLAVYLKYDGYQDLWDRSGVPADWRAAFPDPYGFGEVERVLWGATMVARGLAAPALARRVRAEVAASVASAAVAERLWAAAAAAPRTGAG